MNCKEILPSAVEVRLFRAFCRESNVKAVVNIWILREYGNLVGRYESVGRGRVCISMNLFELRECTYRGEEYITKPQFSGIINMDYSNTTYQPT
jgi:hypothetical protein